MLPSPLPHLMPLRKISADEFARRLKDTSRESDKRFAFFLGAGCSVTSGIPAAGGLVRDHWLPRLRGYRAPHLHHDDWIREELPDYDAANPGAHYGAVMERLFFHPEERQREIERLCDGRFPGFGYATLSSLIAMEGGTFNVVLTTNFDDLVADALYLFTKARPLIIHHESLASYIRPTRTRPLIVKLHGDNRLTPRNTSEETERLQAGIESQVRPVLKDRGLIFIGYGGNDQSVAGMLEKLPPEALPLGVYWVSGEEPNCRLREWLDKRDAIWVEKGDFDEFMLLVRNAFNLPHPERKRFEDVFERYTDTYEVLSKRITALPDAAPDAPALKEAVKRTDQSFPDWWAVTLEAMRIEMEEPDKAEAIYRRGLQQFPTSAPLLRVYASFLERVRKDYEGAERFHQAAMAVDPQDPDNLGAYAVFLEKIRKDYDSSEGYFRRALSVAPEDPDHLGNYALFLQHARKDYDSAESHFRRALEAYPEHPNNLGNYAVFLQTIRRDYDSAEDHFRRALAADPEQPGHLGNYAAFLQDIRKDYKGAEVYFRHALELDPDNPSLLGNYALFLQDIRKEYDSAEEYFRRATAGDPENANHLGNYAAFLQNIRKEYDGAEEHYRRALLLNPEDEIHHGNYAIFLQSIRKDYEGAEEHFRRALASHPKHPNHIGNYGVFLQNIRKNFDGAEEFFRRALEADPEHANTLGNYAGFLLAFGRDPEGLSFLDHAMRLTEVEANDSLRVELLFYLFANGPAERKGESLSALKRHLEAGLRSPGWDFSLNIERAKREAHPHSEWLERLAAVITENADLSTLDAWDVWKNAEG